MKQKNLFEIEQEFLDLMELIEENEGEVTDEILEKLHINKNEFQSKMKGYYYVLLQKKGDLATIKERMEVLKKKSDVIDKSMKAMKAIMADAIELYGEKGDGTGYKLKTAEISLWTVHHKPLKFTDEDLFDNDKYVKYIIKNKLSKETLDKIQGLIGGTLDIEKNIDKDVLKKDLDNNVTGIKGVILDTEAKYLGMK